MIKDFDIFFILLALAFFFWGIYRRSRLWFVGKKEIPSAKEMGTVPILWLRIRSVLIDAIAHRRILKEFYPGLLHLLLFLGFVAPLGVIIITQPVFTLPSFIAKILSFALDVIALAAIVSLVLFIIRRYITRPSRLDNRPEDLTALILILLIILTGLTLESLRLSVVGKDSVAWAPLGRAISALWNSANLGINTRGLLATIVFRVHFFLVLAAVAYIPYSKLFHVISSPWNMFFRSLEPKGVLSRLDLEDEKAESFGVSKIEDFTWKQLMDLDACTRCGRCQDHCPAYLTEKPLSPKKLIIDLKDNMHKRGPQVIEARAKGAAAKDCPPLVGNVIEEDALWACTTCRSCIEHCPVFIEHVAKVIDMRRYQVLMESKFPEKLTSAFKGLERNSNPWGMGRDSRADWANELKVPVISEDNAKELEYLLYVGCLRSYDDRNKKVAIAMTRILKHLGVKFAILGKEEGCCGDPARRVGNEYLYQVLAQSNIETLKRYGVRRILATCPHCYNTLKNEYAQLGFTSEVVHHAQFLSEKIREGRLKIDRALAKRITYHDPCYLGRYSGIYSEPRQVLKAIPWLSLREMKRSRQDSFCCGAGGGWMWMDEKIGKRINIQRLEDALATDPEWIATACPFCITMFEDAVKNKNLEDKVKIFDLAEVVGMALFESQ